MKVLCTGSFVCDIVVPNLPYIGPPGSLTYAPNGIHLSPGGHAANVSINLIQLCQDEVAVAGSLGKDILGDYITDSIISNGIQFYPMYPEGTGTAKNIALIVHGQDKRFIAELTANTLLTPQHIIKTLKETHPELFYIGTVGGLRYVDTNLPQILQEAHKIDSTTLVDVIMPENDWKYLSTALPHIDILHINEDEVRAYTGSSPEKALDYFLNKGVKIVIISSGSRGLTTATNDLKVTLEAFKVKEIDPTGAGDALCAGMIKAYLKQPVNCRDRIEENCLKSILLTGEAAGAACVTGVGASTNVTKDRVEKLIREQGEIIWDKAKKCKC